MQYQRHYSLLARMIHRGTKVFTPQMTADGTEARRRPEDGPLIPPDWTNPGQGCIIRDVSFNEEATAKERIVLPEESGAGGVAVYCQIRHLTS